jgi:hypothetical protein
MGLLTNKKKFGSVYLLFGSRRYPYRFSKHCDKFTGVVYYESMKRELKTRPIYECRCDERLKTKAEESTRLTYTGLLGELEHLKIETRLIDERFASVMGEMCLRHRVGVNLSFICVRKRKNIIISRSDKFSTPTLTTTVTRLNNRLGKGNRRTDVQRIRGQSTDERISTDLDCTKSRLLCVETLNLF